MNLIEDIETGEKAPHVINVVVENCKGSYNKVEYDEDKHVFRLDRVLYSAVYWPFEYGFVPQTKGEDADPLDICVLITNPTFPGCILKARPIGVLMMEDEKGTDDKIIAVATEDPVFSSDHAFTDIKNIQPHTLREIKEFFETYKKLEPGKWVKFKEWKDSATAKKIVVQAMERFKKEEKEKKKKTRK